MKTEFFKSRKQLSLSARGGTMSLVTLFTGTREKEITAQALNAAVH